MTLRLYRAAEVCDIAGLQQYVLRSWEKEFPGIGVQKTPDGPRLYRQSDVEQVQRIKQLVFGEGLTVAGARRKLEEADATKGGETNEGEILELLDAEARVKVASVRDGLRALQSMLAQEPRAFTLEPPPVKAAQPTGKASPRAKSRRVSA